jgi:hypothetical protein
LKKLLFFILILLIGYCSSQKVVKDREIDAISNYMLFDYINLLNENDYYSLVDSVKSGVSKDFFSLRMAYTKTNLYDPYGKDIENLKKEMVNYVEKKNFKKALMIADRILEKKYTDIKTHLYCSQIYKQLNDIAKSDYHYNIYSGLINSIYFSGDGKNVKTAFIVTEVSEESDLIDWLGLKSNGQNWMIKDGFHFDIIKISDEDKEKELFFNVDLPLRKISKKFE